MRSMNIDKVLFYLKVLWLIVIILLIVLSLGEGSPVYYFSQQYEIFIHKIYGHKVSWRPLHYITCLKYIILSTSIYLLLTSITKYKFKTTK